MLLRRCKTLALSGLVLALALTIGCAKKVAKVNPPAPPASPMPTATLAANPATIERGQSTQLTWQVSNANETTISGLGVVAASGSRTLTPDSSTTYTLTAKGPGGSQDASARVTVNERAVRATSSPTDEDLFARNVKDVFFDYNKSEIRQKEMPTAQNDAAFLTQHPNIKVLIEGHCDDRGSEEYNLALGTSRAESIRQSLIQQGVSADRLKTVSYGKEKPFCNEDNEQCWQANRVDHFAVQH